MKNEFQHIDNFKPGDKSAIMRLNRPISSDPNKGITGESFSREHDFLVANGVEKLLIPINSVGGNIFQGLEIFATIQDSPMETETRVVGISASMAGVISQAGNKRTIKQHARFHAHSPRPEAGKNVGAEMLQMAYNQLKTIFVSNSSMVESVVDEMLSHETFMSPSVAMENGLFDEVLTSSGKVPEISAEMDAEEMMNIFNQLENYKCEPMTKVNSLLGLAAEAGEKSVIDAVVTLQAAAQNVETLSEEKTALKAKIVELENSLVESNKAKATTLVENAITAGKIQEEQKSIWVENATTNFESAKLMLDGLKGASASASIMDDKEINKDVDKSENRAEWGFEEWSKNDPSGLEKMQTENKAKYEAMFNAYVG